MRITIPHTEELLKSNPSAPAGEITPTLVNVWASFCEPCKDELPLLERLSRQGTLRVVGLSRDTERAPAVRLLREAGVTYENWRDPDAKFAVALDGRIPLNFIPCSALIVEGKVVAVHVGELKNEAEVLAGVSSVVQQGR